MKNKKLELAITNLVMGHTTVTPKFTITLRMEELREVIKGATPDKSLRITVGETHKIEVI